MSAFELQVPQEPAVPPPRGLPASVRGVILGDVDVPLNLPTMDGPGPLVAEEAALWFSQKFELTLCGKRLGVSAARKLIIAMAATMMLVVVGSLIAAIEEDSPSSVIGPPGVGSAIAAPPPVQPTEPGRRAYPVHRMALNREFPSTDADMATFQLAFKTDVAALTRLDVAAVIIDMVTSGSVVTDFHLVAEPSNVAAALAALDHVVGISIAGGVVLSMDGHLSQAHPSARPAATPMHPAAGPSPPRLPPQTPPSIHSPPAPPPAEGSAVFSFTGAAQTFTVPTGVSRVAVKLWGAGGGAGIFGRGESHSSGGGGGYTAGFLPVTVGETLTVMVGEGGYTAHAMTGPSFGGGGQVMSDYSGIPNAGCGGGRSAIFRGDRELATAGGGGGGGEGAADWNDGHGGGGGGLEGRPATDSGLAYAGDGTLGGSGGTQTQRGGGGTCDDSNPHHGQCTNRPLAGTGGGGWFGGGSPSGNDKSGGGGSGYIGGLSDGDRTAETGVARTLAGGDGAVGVGGAAAGQSDVDYPGAPCAIGGTPQSGELDPSTGGGGKAGDGQVVIRWQHSDPASWASATGSSVEDPFAGPVDCSLVHSGGLGYSGADDVCISGVQSFDSLWRDRDYAWITGPADILDGQWTYMRPAMEHQNGAPCYDPQHPDNNGREGGFHGTLDEPTVVAICCANHCGTENIPIDDGQRDDNSAVGGDPTSSLSWTTHPGSWAISGHDGAPCTFYESRLLAGEWHLCCSSCWGSGVFLAEAQDNAAPESSGPLACDSIQSTAVGSTCVPAVAASETLWLDRDYAWANSEAPVDLLDGEWSYIRTALEVQSGAPCSTEGGFRGTVLESTVAAVCCANHCGDGDNLPTGGGAWTRHPGTFGITGHGGEPCTFFETRLESGTFTICCSSCWASGAFFSHFHHDLPLAEDAALGSAGLLACEAIASETASVCVAPVIPSGSLWNDRDYSWISGPSDIMDGDWSYIRVALETGNGAPCPHEGGFRGSVREDAAVAVCCANHCGQTNQPTGSSLVWTQHPGTFEITGHSGAPCTFYETRVAAGNVNICCGSCWASGVFFGVAEELGEIRGTGLVPCSAVVPDTENDCVSPVVPSEPLWSDRQYAWIDGPTDIMDGDWTYIRVPLETGSGAPCPHEGGFSGSISVEAVVAVCCANHCGSENMPTAVGPSGMAAPTWLQHPGAFEITGHPGAPCTFFETQLAAGQYQICCESCWASGLFLSGQDSSEPVSCSAILASGITDDGIYQIDPDGAGGSPSFAVYCDMTTAGGGWTLVMTREDDVPTFITAEALSVGVHGRAITDARFLAVKRTATQILVINSGTAIYNDGASMQIIADVNTLNRANCRAWSEVTSLLQTPLVWDEDDGCTGTGSDYSELLGHGNANDGGGRDVSSLTHAGRHNYFGGNSQLQLYQDAAGNGNGGNGEFQFATLYLRAGIGGSSTVSAEGSTVFSFTGAAQTFTVPTGVSRVAVKLWGAGGGAGIFGRGESHSSGGGGGYTAGFLPVTVGETLTVMVGEGGYTAHAMTGPSFGGGGQVMSDYSGIPNAGCGGGRSAIFRGDRELATAGGGGGGGEGAADWNDGHGGGGGGLEGRPATDSGLAYAGDGTLGGSGGTQTQRGGGGTCDDSNPHHGQCTNRPLAGTGGGGWFGGGSPSGNDKSGGGGSGYIGGLSDGDRTAETGVARTLAGGDGAVGVGGAAAGQSDVDYPGAPCAIGGTPQSGELDPSTGGGGKAGDGQVVIRWQHSDPASWASATGSSVEDPFAGPVDCSLVHSGGLGYSGADDVCISGVQSFDSLWRDRDYAWITGPADILDGQWTYMRPAMEHQNGAPCYDPQHPDNNGREGGFHGTLDEPTVVAICCANHCGTENIPIDDGQRDDNSAVGGDPTSSLSWTTHPGSWAISGHDGAPCTFYESRLLAGEWHLCCSSCWGSGVFLAEAQDNAAPESSGPLACDSIQSTAVGSTCVPAVAASETLWLDRDYAWANSEAPVDLLDGEWSYIRTALEVQSGAPCSTEGGFRGTVLESTVAAVCCANHCGDGDNLPTGGGAWTRHPGTFGITGHGGEPCTFFETRLESGTFTICCSSCWASGAFFSHFHHDLPLAEDAALGSAGLLACEAIASETASVCVAPVIPSGSLWNDRDYSWISGPSDIMDGDWSYIRVALETGNGAPCPHEGGFRGSVREDAAVAVCCANHCGQTNQPTGSSLVWTQHPGTFEITGHSGAPCTFYETRVAAGNVNICCGSCWASGVFFGVAEELGEIRGTGLVPCSAVVPDTENDCVSPVVPSEPLWSDRQYAWIDGPTDIMDGDWTYIRVPLETGSGAPCPHEGGFSGSISVEAVVAVCCANHCGSENMPTAVGPSGMAAPTWLQHPGAFEITGHPGAPCTFFETQLAAGQYQICCESCWASGLFLSGQDSSEPVSCSAILASGITDDGIYQIDPDGAGGSPSFAVYCDMTTAGGGWTLVMTREDDVPTFITAEALSVGVHGRAITDARFLAVKRTATQILVINSGTAIYNDGASMQIIADVNTLNRANCRAWSEVTSLLQTPLVWDEDDGCTGTGSDYSELLGHGNANDGGGRDVSSLTHAGRHNYFGGNSQLQLYQDAAGNGNGGNGEFQFATLYLRAGIGGSSTVSAEGSADGGR